MGNIIYRALRKIARNLPYLKQHIAYTRSLECMVAERDCALAERDNVLTERDHTLAERERRIDELERTVAQRDGHIGELELSIGEMKNEITACNEKYSILKGEFDERWEWLLKLEKEKRELKLEIVKAKEHGLSERESCSSDKTSVGNTDIDKRSPELKAYSSMILLSIVIPVYKTEKYLHKCLDSLVNQTLENIEIIVVNDGSPDNSQDIIDDFYERYPGLIVPLKQENAGQGAARNLGVRYARGEYIGFVDSDDWVEPDMYQLLYGVAKTDNSDVVICDMCCVNEDDGTNWISKGYRGKSGDYLGVADFVLQSTNPAMACNKIIRRQLLRDTPFVPEYYYEDIATTPIILSFCDKVSYFAKPLYYYLQRKGSTITQSYNPKNLGVIDAWKRCLEGCNPVYTREMAYSIYYSISVFIDFKSELSDEYKLFFKENEKRFKYNTHIMQAISNKEVLDLFELLK